MSDLLVNNLVLLAITLASLWWTIGGRDRRALGAIRDRLEVIELLPEDDELAHRLRREVRERSKAYLTNPSNLVVRLVVYAAVALGSGVATAAWLHHRGDGWQDALSAGIAVGTLAGAAYVTVITTVTLRKAGKAIAESRQVLGDHEARSS